MLAKNIGSNHNHNSSSNNNDNNSTKFLRLAGSSLMSANLPTRKYNTYDELSGVARLKSATIPRATIPTYFCWDHPTPPIPPWYDRHAVSMSQVQKPARVFWILGGKNSVSIYIYRHTNMYVYIYIVCIFYVYIYIYIYPSCQMWFASIGTFLIFVHKKKVAVTS